MFVTIHLVHVNLNNGVVVKLVLLGVNDSWHGAPGFYP